MFTKVEPFESKKTRAWNDLPAKFTATPPAHIGTRTVLPVLNGTAKENLPANARVLLALRVDGPATSWNQYPHPSGPLDSKLQLPHAVVEFWQVTGNAQGLLHTLPAPQTALVFGGPLMHVPQVYVPVHPFETVPHFLPEQAVAMGTGVQGQVLAALQICPQLLNPELHA